MNYIIKKKSINNNFNYELNNQKKFKLILNQIKKEFIISSLNFNKLANYISTYNNFKLNNFDDISIFNDIKNNLLEQLDILFIIANNNNLCNKIKNDLLNLIKKRYYYKINLYNNKIDDNKVNVNYYNFLF